MQIFDLDQNGPDWHRWRAQGLGGSDAPTIMNDNNFQCPDELLAVKHGRKVIRETDAMRRGKEREPIARVKYQQMTGIRCRPVCVVHDEFPWLRASLDGLSEDGQTVLEIKCPTSPGTHYQALANKVPRYYWAQVQHQLAVTGCPVLHFFTYFPNDSLFPVEKQCALVKVLPDQAYIQRLIAHEKRFWERYQREADARKGQGRVQGQEGTR